MLHLFSEMLDVNSRKLKTRNEKTILHFKYSKLNVVFNIKFSNKVHTFPINER